MIKYSFNLYALFNPVFFRTKITESKVRLFLRDVNYNYIVYKKNDKFIVKFDIDDACEESAFNRFYFKSHFYNIAKSINGVLIDRNIIDKRKAITYFRNNEMDKLENYIIYK